MIGRERDRRETDEAGVAPLQPGTAAGVFRGRPLVCLPLPRRHRHQRPGIRRQRIWPQLATQKLRDGSLSCLPGVSQLDSISGSRLRME
jgi:hypothetical protein